MAEPHSGPRYRGNGPGVAVAKEGRGGFHACLSCRLFCLGVNFVVSNQVDLLFYLKAVVLSFLCQRVFQEFLADFQKNSTEIFYYNQ